MGEGGRGGGVGGGYLSIDGTLCYLALKFKEPLFSLGN